MTRRRRFLLPLVFAALFFSTTAAAETVLVAVYQSGSEEMTQQSRFLLSAVEDGIMDLLFDEGHITFNVGSFDVVGPSAIQARYDVRQLAREGGADFAVHVTVEIVRLENDQLEPQHIDYRFVNVNSDQIYTQGRIELDNLDNDGRLGWEELCFNAGREIARLALAGW